MERLPVDPHTPAVEAIARAASIIKRGGLVAMPTETVYGLAANALDSAAVARIFSAKGRPSFNPLIVHIAEAGDLPRVARDIPAVAHELAAHFWPGPLTLVLHRQPVVPDNVTGGQDTVGVRVPGHAVARALIRAAGCPLAAPSANPFMRVSPTTAQHVVDGLGDAVDLILDAGPTTLGIESSVVDLTTSPPRFLRPGGVTREALRPFLPLLADATELGGDAPRPSPGMIARHYAPRTRLRLFPTGGVADALAYARTHPGTVVLARQAPGLVPDLLLRAMPADPKGFARELYAVLHALDAEKRAMALIESPPEGDDWEAIRDRLRRAVEPVP